MRKGVALAALCFALTSNVAVAKAQFDAGRRAYAMMQAGAEYCPDIEETWTAGLMIKEGYSYDPLVNDAELHLLMAEKKKLFDSFRTVPRVMVCEMLIEKFGPGGTLELFQFE